MTKEALASWVLEHSSVPQTVLKPLATRLGVPLNHVGAALFAGQLVYENQDAIVEYGTKGGVAVGEFLRQRAGQRYGEDHPLTQYLGENVDAITEAFEGTEAEARTFAEFYRRYRSVDRERRLSDGVDFDVRERLPEVPDAVPGRDAIPDFDPKESITDLGGTDAIPEFSSTDRLPDLDEATDVRNRLNPL